jgi:hypothetical protein
MGAWRIAGGLAGGGMPGTYLIDDGFIVMETQKI